MYPQAELTQLARRNFDLRQRIAARRAECVAAATRVTRPLVWLDQALDLWRQISPLAKLAAVPMGWLAMRSLARRAPRLRKWLRWALLVAGVLRSFSRPRY